jgi:hypothetical protein
MKAVIDKQHFTIFTRYQRVEEIAFLRVPPRHKANGLRSRHLA